MSTQGNLFNVTASIAAAENGTTDAIHMAKFALVKIGVENDAVATKLSFLAGNASDNLKPLCNQDGTLVEVTLSTTANGEAVYALNANDFAAIEYIKVVSNATESAAVPIRLYGYKV